FVSVVPVLCLGFVGDSYPMLLVLGFFLGIAGTSFAVGVPFVNAWHAPERRGFATGVFGVGMGGTALSAFLTPYLADSLGLVWTHVLMAVALALMGVLVLVVCRNPPDWRPATASLSPRVRAGLGRRATWRYLLLCAVAYVGVV